MSYTYWHRREFSHNGTQDGLFFLFVHLAEKFRWVKQQICSYFRKTRVWISTTCLNFNLNDVGGIIFWILNNSIGSVNSFMGFNLEWGRFIYYLLNLFFFKIVKWEISIILIMILYILSLFKKKIMRHDMSST